MLQTHDSRRVAEQNPQAACLGTHRSVSRSCFLAAAVNSRAIWLSIIKASETMRVPYVEDLNSPLHPSHGCAKMHFNIDSRGYRSSTYSAFLPKELVYKRKSHLHVCVRTVVCKIETETAGDGLKTAVGVYVQAANSPRRFVHARKEVILSSGPISSPQVLMLR